MAVIKVKAPDSEYDIVIQEGMLNAEAAVKFALDKAVVVTNDTVAPLHGEQFAAAIGAPLIVMRDGERYKNLETVAGLYADFVAAGMDRSSTVIALGGGVIGDTAGFAAATYMRGVRLVQVPTSLLAMVDSSVGGKVGVDLPQGKNLVGAFKQPDLVLIDPQVLSTLLDVEWRNGMAEVLKHGLIADARLLDPVLHTRENAAALVKQAVQVKVDVVQRDPYEQNERAHLNLGHTFGHAVEQVTQYAVPHGQAVAVGLHAAAELSLRLGLCDEATRTQTVAALENTGLPHRLDRFDRPISAEALWAAMQTDKKWKGGQSRFVLLRDVGEPCIIEGVAKDDVMAVLRHLGAT